VRLGHQGTLDGVGERPFFSADGGDINERSGQPATINGKV